MPYDDGEMVTDNEQNCQGAQTIQRCDLTCIANEEASPTRLEQRQNLSRSAAPLNVFARRNDLPHQQIP